MPATRALPHAVAALALTASVLAHASGPPRAPDATPSLTERVVADSASAVALLAERRFADVHARIAPDLARARAADDHAAIARLLRIEGLAHAVAQRALPALTALDEAERLAERVGEPALRADVARWRAYALGLAGRLDAQRDEAERLLALARILRDPRREGLAEDFLGWNAHARGDYARARAHLERAVALHRARGAEGDEALALVTLGSVYMQTGVHDSARAVYQRQLVLARHTGSEFLVAQALNDLGVLEHRVGDPALAERHYRAALASHLSRHETLDALLSLHNLTQVEIELQRLATADSLARLGVAWCERDGFRGRLGGHLALLADIAARRGDTLTAVTAWRRTLALGDTAEPGVRIAARLRLDDLTPDRPGDQEEASLLEFRAALGARAPLGERLTLDLAIGRAQRRAGRAHAAVTTLTGVATSAERAGLSDLATEAWRFTALAQRGAGNFDGARATLTRALAVWEHGRARPSDPEWREVFARETAELGFACASFPLVDPALPPGEARVAAAFAVAERMRARTLLERMAGPGALPADSAAAPPADVLAALRARGLRDGEVLIEYLTSPGHTLAFAVRRDRIAAAELPGTDALEPRVRLACAMLASHPREPGATEAAEAVAAELGRTLLGPLAPLLDGARVVIVSPDGPLHAVPFAALSPRPGAPPLVATHEVARVPSAATLLAARDAERGAATRARVMAYAGDAAGEPRLSGARSEVRSLAARFADVEVRTPGPRDPAPAPDEWRGHEVIHLAGHAVLDDQYPWRSSLHLGGRPDAARGRDPELRAGTLARARLDARLIVLSSCASARGRETRGEGVAGLTSACLAARVPSVVATLWPVEDRVTERFMSLFYDGLAAGHDVGESLREAQARLRAEPTTRHPFHWAAFVVAGDPATRLPLRGRPRWPVPAAAGAGAAAVLAGIGFRRARRRAVIPAGPGGLTP